MTAFDQATILVIDDDEAVRLSIADYLEDRDFRVVKAENGRIGLERFQSEEIDLVLVDLRMPEMDGLEVLASISQTKQETPLVVVSGTGVISDVVEALHRGAWDYILKPIEDFSVLIHAIETNLEKARLKNENLQYQKHLEKMVADRTSELSQANEYLSRNEQQFRTILDNIRIGVVIVDVETKRIVYVNPTTAEMVGTAIEELSGSFCYQTICPCAQDGCQVLDLGLNIDSSEQILTAHGGLEIPILKTVTRILYQGKECLLESFIDLSKQKAAAAEKEALEKQLRHVQRIEAIGTLAGGVAHDFNNILNVILGNTELAIMEAPEDQETTEYLYEVKEAGHRAVDLVKQILTISRRGETEKKPVQISLIMKDVIKMLRATLPTTIDIVNKIDTDSGMTLADATQIHQILMNLATNAAHAMGKTGGILSFELKNVDLDETSIYLDGSLGPGAYLRLTVADTGHGIDPQTLERIFDPYFTTKTHGEGTGLGLAVVMGIVKDCAGSISVQSKTDNGTCFDLFFPRVDDDGQPDKPKSAAIDLPTGTEQILVVDDEKQIGILTWKMLSKLGYNVRVESDSMDALRRFRDNPGQIDLVISDVTMPKLPGDELAREMLHIRPEIPIILCSGYSSRITEHEAKSMGVREYLLKPISLEELAIVVRRSLDG